MIDVNQARAEASYRGSTRALAARVDWPTVNRAALDLFARDAFPDTDQIERISHAWAADDRWALGSLLVEPICATAG
ncbi:hypothetical protein GCM10027572_11530 [Flexivirga lutea]